MDAEAVRYVSGLRDPKLRVRAASFLLVACVFGWPASAVTVAASEPPVILGLSWFALILTALNILATTDVRREQDSDTGELTECVKCGYRA